MLVEKVSAALKDSIRQAQSDIDQESEQRLFDEGILRHVPMVGSMLNWFSPPPKLPALGGRRFLLQSVLYCATCGCALLSLS